MRRLILLALLPSVLSCSWSDVFGKPDALAVLRRNRDRWNALGISTYTLDFQLTNCECLPTSTQPVSIFVALGTIFDVRNRTTGDAVAPSSLWPTVDSLFARAERDLIAGYQVSITYSGAYHFPGRMSRDNPGAVDDEYTTIANLYLDLILN